MLQTFTSCQATWRETLAKSPIKQEVADAFRGFHAGFNTMKKSVFKVGSAQSPVCWTS